MSTLTRDRVYNFRVNNQLFEEAKNILESKNISLSDALNLFVEQIVLEKGLPIKTADQLKAEVFLGELKAELDKRLPRHHRRTSLRRRRGLFKVWTIKVRFTEQS